MIYYTIRQKNKDYQLTWLDIINDEPIKESHTSVGGTITRCINTPTEEMLKAINVDDMIDQLKAFNFMYNDLFLRDRKSMYFHFTRPKKNGGLRPIDAPCEELQSALERLNEILTMKFGVLYHTSAFAYVKQRSTYAEVERHQRNNSNWFFKSDFSGFFPNTNIKFVMDMCSIIFPLSEICKVPEGYRELKKALSLGFLNGGLPQGTKLSPSLTNLIMVPLDHEMANYFASKHMVYTRYADDIHISCVQKFDPKQTENYIKGVLRKWNAPWEMKPEKTTFGNKNQANWMLGLMLNKDNNITVGWEKKKIFKAMTTNLIMDYKNDYRWPVDEVQQYQGLISYYTSIEKDYFEKLLDHFNHKFHCDVRRIIKDLVSIS